MKATEFKEMSTNELVVKLASLKEELFNLRFQHKAGQLENTSKLKDTRRNIARAMTIIELRNKGILAEPVKAAAKSKAKKSK